MLGALVNDGGARELTYVRRGCRLREELESLLGRFMLKSLMRGWPQDPMWVVLFMGNAISVEVQCEGDGGRCLMLSQLLA